MSQATQEARHLLVAGERTHQLYENRDRWNLRSHQLKPGLIARSIVETLEEAKASPVTHLYGGNGLVRTHETDQQYDAFTAAGWEQVGYWTWRVPEGVYDLYTSRRFLAEREGRLTRTGAIIPSYYISFARCSRTLANAGVLIFEGPNIPQVEKLRFARRSEI